MNILAFDTSLNKTYIVLSKGDFTVSKIYESDENNYHSAYLISGIKKLLEENSITLKEIDFFAVNNGPGSFTGIRAGVTVAKTLAKELNKNVAGLNSLDILYNAYQSLNPDIILDARRGQFYFRSTVSGSANKSETKLIPYSEISNLITKNTIVCDASSIKSIKDYLQDKDINIINFEEDDINLSNALITLAKEYSNNDNLSWNTLSAAYIQAPPIHKKK